MATYSWKSIPRWNHLVCGVALTCLVLGCRAERPVAKQPIAEQQLQLRSELPAGVVQHPVAKQPIAEQQLQQIVETAKPTISKKTVSVPSMQKIATPSTDTQGDGREAIDWTEPRINQLVIELGLNDFEKREKAASTLVNAPPSKLRPFSRKIVENLQAHPTTRPVSDRPLLFSLGEEAVEALLVQIREARSMEEIESRFGILQEIVDSASSMNRADVAESVLAAIIQYTKPSLIEEELRNTTSNLMVPITYCPTAASVLDHDYIVLVGINAYTAELLNRIVPGKMLPGRRMFPKGTPWAVVQLADMQNRSSELSPLPFKLSELRTIAQKRVDRSDALTRLSRLAETELMKGCKAISIIGTKGVVLGEREIFIAAEKRLQSYVHELRAQIPERGISIPANK
jgi:hypothetical protein